MPPTSDPVVRRAGLDDAEVVGALTERVYAAGGWTDEGYSNVLRDARSRIEDAIVMVATIGGQVVGTVTIALPATRFANICRPDEVEVRMTDRDWQVGSFSLLVYRLRLSSRSAVPST